MTEEHWQLQIASRSLKKREKLKLLKRHLEVKPSSVILDLGCAQGILSFYLRQKGGEWISADQDFENLKSSQTLLKKNLLLVGEGPLPFRDESLDMVVSLDYLEHLENDQFCLEEIQRVLKRGGVLLAATPRTGRLFILHKIRSLLGMKLAFYGHKREGYSRARLETMMREAHLEPLKHLKFAGFLTEFIELMLNLLYLKFYPSEKPAHMRDGHIRPSTSQEFQSKKKVFKAYSLFYPLVWIFTRLDKIFFFQRGYGLIVWAMKADTLG